MEKKWLEMTVCVCIYSVKRQAKEKARQATQKKTGKIGSENVVSVSFVRVLRKYTEAAAIYCCSSEICWQKNKTILRDRD